MSAVTARPRRSIRQLPWLALGAVLVVAPLSLSAATHAAAAPGPDLRPMAPTGPIAVVGVNGALPSESTCAARVVRTAENRPGNTTFNNTRGSSPNNENSRVTGNFVGSTDEILQWAACKWGLSADWARAQATIESNWHQDTSFGDFGTDPAACLPGHPIGADGRPGECPQSVGLLQVRYPFHQSAFENNNAIRSTAYNVDYTFSLWRRCFNGEYTWLNTVERGRDYGAGDGLGCMGVWFSGRWYTQPAVEYMNRVSDITFPRPAPLPAPPSAPSSLTATPVRSGTVQLVWGAPVSQGGSPVTDYIVQRSWDGGRTWTSLSDGPGTGRTYTATGLANGRSYRFRVAARNASGTGPARAVSVVPRALPPSAPLSLTATAIGSGTVRLNWAAPTSNGGWNIVDYVVQRSWDGGRTWVSLSDGYGTALTFVATGQANNKTYRYRVAARNGIGWGPPSRIAYVYTTAASGAARPTALLADAPIELPLTSEPRQESTVPDSIVPEPTTESTVPESTTPEATMPDSVVPESTAPDTIGPDSIAPDPIEPTATADVAPDSTEPTATADVAPDSTETSSSPAGDSEPPPPTEVSTTEIPATPPTEVPTTPAPTTAATVAEPVRPDPQAAGCAAVNLADLGLVDAALASGGLFVARATSSSGAAGRYLVGTIYDTAGNPVTGPETWIVVDGRALTVSRGAVGHGDVLGDANVEAPAALDPSVAAGLVACAAG